MNKFLQKHTSNLHGKTIAISGATGGLGQELCKLLAQNGAHVVLIDRNAKKQANLVEQLKTAFPTAEISTHIADMEDIVSVHKVAQELQKSPLHGLILNAGAYSIPRHKTAMGWDNVFQINCVSPLYLAKKLLPHLESCGGRVVAVGSIAHNYSKIDKSDVDFSTRKKASLVYGNAKRYLTYALLEMAQNGHPVVVAHPGISFTGITSHYPKLIFAIIKHPMKVIFPHPKKACLSIYYGLFCNVTPNTWIGPKIFDVWGLPKIKKLNTAKPAERQAICQTAQQIWQGCCDFLQDA